MAQRFFRQRSDSTHYTARAGVATGNEDLVYAEFEVFSDKKIHNFYQCLFCKCHHLHVVEVCKA